MNHVELTIADLTAARNRADVLIQGLREFQAGCDGTTTAPTAAVAIHPAGNGAGAGAGEVAARLAIPAPVRIKTAQRAVPTKNVPRGTGKQARPHKNTPKSDGITAKLFKAAQSLPEPFTAQDLANAAEQPRKQCENFLVHRVADKVFAREGRGLYLRGKKFPYVTRGMGNFVTKATETPSAPTPDTTIKRAINVRKLGERPSGGEKATGPKVPPAQSTQALLDGKATSVGAAMKVYIRQHPKFAGADLIAFLQGDTDYAKLLDQASPSAVPGNLGYWVSQGYLDRAGGNQVVDSTFTVTAAGNEWFAK